MSTIEAIQIKVNDVFLFRYNNETVKNMFDPYHCFDGTLIVKEWHDESLRLQDTYWSGGSYSRAFTLEEAQEKGKLTFVCNLSEVKKVTKNDDRFYDAEDFIELYMHHGYHNEYYVRPEAQRSKQRMLDFCKEKIEKAESEIRWATSRIETTKKEIEKIESGDLSIWI